MDINVFDSEFKRCINQGTIGSSEPNFMRPVLIPKEQVQEQETNEVINKVFDGCASKLFAAFVGRNNLSTKEIEKLKQIVGDWE